MILVHVQKMYNIFRILKEVPNYSSSFFFSPKNEEEAIPPGREKIFRDIPPPLRPSSKLGVPDYSSSEEKNI